jgi:protein-S-isoprenylcysteine O-methyltransferase Ste14
MTDKVTTTIWYLSDFLAQGLVVVYPAVLVFWLILHSNIDRWRTVGRTSYWIASIGLPILGGAVLIFREPIFSLQWVMPSAIRIAGIAAFAASLVLGRIASRKIPLRTLVGIPELEPKRVRQPLLDSGIYARTRNPIYLAHWLLIFAMAAITGYAANWALLAADCLLLPFTIRAEEGELRKRYGLEFEEYMKRVPRFLPRITPMSRIH